ncbi:hypothetical protein [Paenibacillus sp. 1A_MP2]|uniref:hypothetical protein n=1 Tax=Paenibacillus sp. 1A_MP2 TaxID=3457495 RepID=UPI003FCCBCE0
MARDRKEERTGFQEAAPYHANYDLQTDFVMVYGIDESMQERIQKWKEKGYIVHLMTGVAWGTTTTILMARSMAQRIGMKLKRTVRGHDSSRGQTGHSIHGAYHFLWLLHSGANTYRC